MELSAITIVGARPLRAEQGTAGPDGSNDLRSAWLSRLPSVQPGSMSEAYRSFRAEGQSAARPGLPALAVAPPLAPPVAAAQPAILTGTMPAALAAYGETMEG